MLEERRIKREKEFIEKSCILHNNYDEIKNSFCLKNNIKLIRINYKEDIKEKLENFLN